MYFINNITDKRFTPWVENFIKQVVRRSKFNGSGLRVEIDDGYIDTIYKKMTITFHTVYRKAEEKYYVEAKPFPEELTKDTLNGLLVDYRLINEEQDDEVKAGKIRIQWKE